MNQSFRLLSEGWKLIFLNLVFDALKLFSDGFDAIGFYLGTPEVGNEHFFIGEVEVLVVSDCGPNVGDVEWEAV